MGPEVAGGRPLYMTRMTYVERQGSLKVIAIAIVLCATCPGSSVSTEQKLSNLSGVVIDSVLGPEPITISLSPKPELSPALKTAARGGEPVALVIKDIDGQSSQPIRVNVFLNKPGANRTTPLEEPNFLGYINISPDRDGLVHGEGRAFDVSSLELDSALTVNVTLVPVVGSSEPPRDAALRVGRVYIRREN
jgi:hypothetical protein